MAQSRRQTIQIDTSRGMWANGDGARVPKGFARKVRNVLHPFGSAGEWVKRPQFTYDNLTNVTGFATWYDEVTGAKRMYATKQLAGFGGIDLSETYVKDAIGETWSTAIEMAAQATAGIGGYVNYRGRLIYIRLDDDYLPRGLRVFNGTTDDSVEMDGSNSLTVQPISIAIYKDRMFMGGANFYITNQLWVSGFPGPDSNYTYDATLWTATNVTSNTASDGGTIYRVTPTNATTASVEAPVDIIFQGDNQGVGSLSWRADLRSTHATYRVPLTMQFRYSRKWAVATNVAIGEIVVPTTANGYRYRVVTNGTTDAATEPAWPTTVGSFVLDNGVNWLCEGDDIAGENQFSLEPLSENSKFATYVCTATAAISTASTVRPVLKFGNTSTPTYTLATVDFAYKDGRTDGDPRKENHGHQVTFGTYVLPFYNVDDEDAASVSAKDRLLWTPIGEPEKIENGSEYPFREVPGDATAVANVGGRLLLFKRDAAQPFAAVEDANIVVLPDGDARRGFGCLHAKALDVFMDYAYFIGENEIYRWRHDMAEPEPLCGDGMRAEIMNKSSASWVESQTAPANVPLLTIDHKQRCMHVYTQKGKWYTYYLDSKSWMTNDVGGADAINPVGYEICGMEYNPNTGNVVFAFTTAASGTAGIARLDFTQSSEEDQISSSGTLPVYAEIWPAAIEPHAPHVDFTIETIRFRHAVTEGQSGQTTTASVSFDGGVTFPKSVAFSLGPLSTGGYKPLEYPVYQSWSAIQPRIVHAGKGGAANFAISEIEADIYVTRGYYPKDKPTFGASSL